MFSTMPHPIFRNDAAALPTFTASASNTPYRPTRSSPLSSSPIRSFNDSNSGSSSPPLSPRDPNIRRDIQSSPTPAPPAVFQSKFATRPTRPNPLAQKREAAQESRRKLFLKNVRQRAEDQRWERRGGEQELLKLEWFSLNKELRAWRARTADSDGAVLDANIEDAARLREEVMRRPRALGMIPEASARQERGLDVGMGADEMLVDMFEQEQQAELDAMAEAGSQQPSTREWPLEPPHWSDDEDYDALFIHYLAQEPQQHQQEQASIHGQEVGFLSDMDLS